MQQCITREEMFFQLPEYNGKEHIIIAKKGGKLLAKLTCDGKLFISEGYQWNLGVVILDKKNPVGDSEMFLSTLVLDVLRQMYRLNHGYFAYNKKTIHKIYMYNMKQSKVATSKRWCYYVICKVRLIWKSIWLKWKV